MVWYTLINDLIVRRMNKKIHKFGMQGSIADEAFIPQAKEMFEREVLLSMRDKGYVPIYDINTQFSTSYDVMHNKFDFDITLYGIYVGKRRAKTIDGFSGQTFYNKA